MKIYDFLGQDVRTLLKSYQTPGKYSVTWDGKGDDGQKLSSGIYIYSLQTDNNRLWKKMLLLK